MSKYTTEVRFICESLAGETESKGYNSVNQIIKQAIPKIFDFDFPIFDESYREVLCGKILKHFYVREIGLETVGLWKLMLDTRLNEIMPYYNQLYKSELLQFNPLEDYKMKKTGNRGKDETRTENGNVMSAGQNIAEQKATAKGKEYNLYSDTPQGALTGVDEEEYLTNARKVTNDDSSDSKSTGSSNYSENKTNTDTLKGTETYLEELSGKIGGTSFSKLLNEYRETFINIDMMVIEELNDLFMQIF